MELRDYLRLLRIHWLPLLLGLVLGSVLALGFSLLQPKVYTADSNALVTVTTPGNTGPSISSESLARSKVNSFVEIGSWRSVAEEAATVLGIDDSPESLVTRVKVTNPTDTTIIRVTANAPSPEEARDLAEAWVRGMVTVISEVEGVPDPATGGITVTPGDSARLPTAPSSPNVKQNVAIGALIGLLLAAGYAVIRTTLDRKIRTPEAVSEQTGLSVVGTLPATPELAKGSGLLPLEPGSEAASSLRLLAEATRELRTNLQYTNLDEPPKAIVMTSPQPGDGKSTTASNLAIVLAQAGQPVVLIDTDLRRPRIAALWNLDNAAGLTDALAGRADVDDITHYVDPEGMLRVITSGRIPPNPSEVLGSQRMLQLVADLTRDAMVIMDAPPLSPVTDAAILAAHADGALLVVGTGKTTIDALQHATESLSRVNAKPLGVVMNRVPTKGSGRASYGYSSEYRTYYGSQETVPSAAAPVTVIPQRPGAGSDRGSARRGR